ncbi:bifunctional riboflavin kinase/FAD synthetase [Parasporobacterium paucivorans]|uniref:Riboflavin biosynthesis protein n=1 Tax=Parasporobacterium paucivorans DSM 15970 TaxID=1122934 RepID=A0A1M6ETZ8_9FIRM|nr:bifunctional riboflavin kinase/FAD synthetase [Parasporobacterium paucivorans]SHI88935.1 riboflavin kinase / FMN adenylyltransferase [Parasporobacterium paucivorans DSM 15970]
MEYITGTKEFSLTDTAITLGKFDGLHKGHRKLLAVLAEEKKKGCLSVVFTFDMPPVSLICGDKPVYLLTRDERRIFHEENGVDVLIEFPFDMETAKMEPEDFVSEILVKSLGVKSLVCGSDFRFGHNRHGDTELLKELGSRYGFDTIVLELERDGDREISSTLIKRELIEGNLKKANEMLGYPFTVIGRVVYGNQLGRMLGSPTLNLLPPRNKILPPDGVYATRTIIEGKSHDGITNVGCKPTVSDEMVRGVETHLLDFEGNLYGKIIEVQFLEFIRPEKKFDNVNTLKNQILLDIERCREAIRGINN